MAASSTFRLRAVLATGSGVATLQAGRDRGRRCWHWSHPLLDGFRDDVTAGAETAYGFGTVHLMAPGALDVPWCALRAFHVVLPFSLA